MQTRYHNYRRKLQSFAENFRFIGLVIPGVYSGWDRMEIISGSSIRMHHDVTGIKGTADDNTTLGPNLGVAVSKQGFFIYEDAPIDITLDTNDTNASLRIDYLIMQHQYLASSGGQSAIYSIIKGALGSATEPSIANPATQVLLGKFYIPANATTHANTIFIKNEIPTLGGYSFRKINSVDIPQVSAGSISSDFNFQKTSGFYYLPSPALNAPLNSKSWTALILRNSTKITQLACNPETGKLYSRASQDSGTTWGSWVNMNNEDTVLNFQPIIDLIGPRVYTEDNYVTDNQTVTQSIDALDIALKDKADEIGVNSTNINNLQSYVGNRTYDDQKIITNGESITTSLNKLDKIYKYATVDNMTALNAIPVNYRYWGMVVRVIADPTSANNVEHKLLYNQADTNLSNNSNWVKLSIEIGDWDMLNINSVTKAHGINDVSRIKSVSAIIRPDSNAPLASYRYDLISGDPATQHDNPQGQVGILGATIGARRRNAGFFVSADFDSTAYNRGYFRLEVD